MRGLALPIVESLSMGTPVITSNVSSLPEAAGPGAVFVDPENPDDIAEKISALIADVPRQSQIAKAGKEHIQLFESDMFVHRMMELYEGLMG